MDVTHDHAAAQRLLERLRGFVATLEPDERALFAALIAPGVAQAYQGDDTAAGADDEVVGFDLDQTSWSPQALPAFLATAIQERDVRVTGLDG